MKVSPNVKQDLKDDILKTLQVKEMDTKAKYLGLPVIASRRKKALLGEIIDKINSKMKGWKDRTLSQAGKEVLIKAVVQAIPNYYMSCFLLLGSFCHDIERATANFY